MTDLRTHPDCAIRRAGDGDDVIFAMCRLIERLMHEGYVYPQRIPELTERVQNMERGDGFLTHAELRRRKTPPTTDEVEDFLA